MRKQAKSKHLNKKQTIMKLASEGAWFRSSEYPGLAFRVSAIEEEKVWLSPNTSHSFSEIEFSVDLGETWKGIE